MPFSRISTVAISESSVKQAIQILESALQKYTGHIRILMALSSYYQQSGDAKKADSYRNKAESILKLKF
jgi:Tfp pilus assembly protein PilF